MSPVQVLGLSLLLEADADKEKRKFADALKFAMIANAGGTPRELLPTFWPELFGDLDRRIKKPGRTVVVDADADKEWVEEITDNMGVDDIPSEQIDWQAPSSASSQAEFEDLMQQVERLKSGHIMNEEVEKENPWL